jgi:hypothetical protein
MICCKAANGDVRNIEYQLSPMTSQTTAYLANTPAVEVINCELIFDAVLNTTLLSRSLHKLQSGEGRYLSFPAV